MKKGIDKGQGKPSQGRAPSDQVAYSYKVTGRVQGVGFRMFARREAKRLGVRGVAVNLDDGSVGIVALGRAESIEEFENAIYKGPPAAIVEEVRRKPADPDALDRRYGTFDVD
jgi:acylphosphatase